MFNESPIVFECQGDKLVGIIHASASKNNIGVLIVVGGPQYRVGSHRQFVLLSRFLAKHGFPAMRFDVRGMGDAGGEQRNFDVLDDDIKAAMDCFMASCPGLERIIIWGLCDAASATLFYGYQDDRVIGMVLLNPWVFTKQGAAKTYLKYYYLNRLLSRDFWGKVFAFKFDLIKSAVSLSAFLKQIFISSNESSQIDRIDDALELPVKMRESLNRFSHPVLIILSGRDLTADEFRDLVKSDPIWQSLLADSRVEQHCLLNADHTFSSDTWRNEVADLTLNWLKKL